MTSAASPTKSEGHAALQTAGRPGSTTVPLPVWFPASLRRALLFAAPPSYRSKAEEAEELDNFLSSMRDDVRRTAAGCKGVGGAAEVADALSRGLFITDVGGCSGWGGG